MFTALQMPFEAAKCLLEQAVSLSAKQPELAITSAQQSLVTFDRVGARRHADRARRLLRGLGISAPATRRWRVARVLLSQRELEVARLGAQGLTTAEIAERLILSPRTVSSHLGHIYTRLGIGSRADLTLANFLGIRSGEIPRCRLARYSYSSTSISERSSQLMQGGEIQ